MKLIHTIFILFLFFVSSLSYATEKAFYVLHYGEKQTKELNRNLSTLKKHHKFIPIVISQAYRIDDKGSVAGYVNEELVALSKAHSIKLMALVTNSGYDQGKVHQFLSSQKAQEDAITSILKACKKHHFYGVQFDFEMVSVKDKNALTQFYVSAAKRLHNEGFKVSYAVIPAFTNNMTTAFLKRTYQNWSGAYDLKALSKSADFITLMAYNQHPDGTLPGANASVVYVEAAIKNALKEVPAHKLSLGIPTYSLYWFSGSQKVAAKQLEISYADANRLINKHGSQLIWNKQDKVHYAVYNRNWLNEYIYLEDASSFKAKLALAKKFKLRGISVFRIGTEDNRIWALL